MSVIHILICKQLVVPVRILLPIGANWKENGRLPRIWNCWNLCAVNLQGFDHFKNMPAVELAVGHAVHEGVDNKHTASVLFKTAQFRYG